MMKYYLGAMLFAIAMLTSCSSDEGQLEFIVSEEPQIVSAAYRLTLETNFTSETHPTDFPEDAMFGSLIGVGHSSQTTVFRIGQMASDAFATYIQSGDDSPLIEELTPVDDGSGGQDFSVNIDTESSIGPINMGSVDVIVSTAGFISFVAALSPSPDWFIGVDSFDVMDDNNQFIENATINLFPLDAGINSGTTYLDEGNTESENISDISSEAPFAISGSPFSNPLATLTITRIN